MKRWLFSLALLTLGIYAAVVLWGVHLGKSFSPRDAAFLDIHALDGSNGELVRQGQAIFDHTPEYASAYTGNTLSCGSCHAGSGMQPYAAPMTGVSQRFPQVSVRAGRRISIKDRVRECFVRSENGAPPTDDAEVMRAVVAYLDWLSPKHGAPVPGAGLLTLPPLHPDPHHGAVLFAAQCAPCHGAQGQGSDQNPPLWGPNSFNDGAGMDRIPKLAAFIQHNMPQNRPGLLSAQDAYDIAGFVHQQPRPPMNPAYTSF
jgi:thiosulfate dehydrogenase